MPFEAFGKPAERRNLERERTARLNSTPVQQFQFVSVTFDTADLDTDIEHSLSGTNGEDILWFVARIDGGAVIYRDPDPNRKTWTSTTVWLRASVPCGAVICLFAPADDVPRVGKLDHDVVSPTPPADDDIIIRGPGSPPTPGTSVDGEITLWEGTDGQGLKRMSGTGIVQVVNGVAAADFEIDDPTGFGGAPDASSPAAILKISGNQYFAELVDDGNSGTTKTIDFSTGNEHRLTATGNCTLTFSNPKDGGRYLLHIVADGTQRTFTWPSDVRWPPSDDPTMPTTSGDVIITTYSYDATSGIYLGSWNGPYTP